jgi:hypothetical protein
MATVVSFGRGSRGGASFNQSTTRREQFVNSKFCDLETLAQCCSMSQNRDTHSRRPASYYPSFIGVAYHILLLDRVPVH